MSATSIKNSQEIDATFLNKTIIPVDSQEYRIGVQQYRDNLDAILKKAKKANVPVLISEVICNIRDQRPFPTMQADSLSEAFQLFTEARALEQNAQFDAARQIYYKAKDLDPIRFRAPEIFNDIIHELGSKYNAPIIPMKMYFKDVSPNGLIANNIILDHVHPDVTGYFLMADAYYQTMREHKHIRENWPKIADVPTLSYLSNWGFTPLDSLYAQLVLMNLTSGWPFTTENFSSISARQSIINRFKLETKLDSIALRTYTDTGYNIQTAHLDLAKYYKRNGEFKLAFVEYKALIYSIPSIDVFYELAVELLVKMKQYQHAQQILTDALKYHRSAFIYKWLGQLNLINNQIKDGIIYLKTSQAFEPNDDQVLFNLTRAYYTIFEFENGDAILKQLSKESGSDRSVKRLSAFRKSQQSRLTKASTHLKEALLSRNKMQKQ